MQPEKRRLMEAAREYWEMGFNIVLVNGKQPLHEWKQWQSQRQTFEEFENLPWDKADGYGVVCGYAPENGLYLAVIDFDVKGTSEQAQAKGREALKHMRITRIEQTPSGGQHRVYLSNKKPRSISAYHDVAALELIGQGKIAIMAPSKGYKRLNDNPPTTVYDVESMFLDALRAVGIKAANNNVIITRKAEFWFDREDLASKPYRGKHPACIQGLLKGVNEGLRNEACIRLACYFANFRMMDVKKVWKILVEWNRLNNPPLPERELRSVFESALKGKYVYGCSDDLLSKYCVGKAECPLGAGNLEPIELIEHELEQQHAIKLHPLIDYHEETGLTIGTLLKALLRTLIFAKEKPIIVQIGNCLLEENFAKPISVEYPHWAFLEKTWNEQILLLASEFYKNKQIEFPAESEVFEKVLQKASYYWYHSDPRVYTLIVCWIIGTYFHPIFVFYPALNPQGQRETGKSTLLELLRRLCWNPTGREVALREADLFRTIQDSRVTYIADITRLDPKSKTYSEVIDVYETGTERGGRVRRIDKETGEPIEYQTYGPKAIATRYELPFTAKTIRIITEKAPNKEYSKRRHKLDFDPEWPKLVNLLLRAAIKYWPKVVEAYSQVEQTEKLTGRPFNYWAPLLAICKVFAPQRYDDLVKLAEEMAELQEKGDRLSEVEDAILAVLLEYPGETATILLKELTEKVQSIVPWVKNWHVVKSALDNLGIVKRRYESRQGVSYQIALDRARQKAEAKGILQEIPEESQIQQTEQKESSIAKVCWICGKPILEQFEKWIFDASTGKPCHLECLKEVNGGLKHG